MLELDLSGQGFEGTRDVEGHNARLLLPDEVNDFHFFELEVELEIDGVKEQPLGRSDRLDVRVKISKGLGDDSIWDSPTRAALKSEYGS